MSDLTLDGDLSQMATQRALLKREGFRLMQSDVYPIVFEEDIPSALKLIYESNVNGWHHYKDEYVGLGICTAEEFDEKISKS